MRDESHESIIGTPQGCIKVRDVKRYATEEERWDQDRFNSFAGVPWGPVPGSGSCRINVRVGAPRLPDDIREKLIAEDRPYVARRFRIKRDDFKDIGPTPLCPGCRCIIRGLPAQNHSELCRSRVEVELIRIGDARIRQEEIRMKEDEPVKEESRKRETSDSKSSSSGLKRDEKGEEIPEDFKKRRKCSGKEEDESKKDDVQEEEAR